MEKAAFSLKHYIFEQATLNMQGLQKSEQIHLQFKPSGIYNPQSGTFELSFVFSALRESDKKEIVSVVCNGIFQFAQPIKFEEIPSFFFANAIAILFPYIRSFVSTLTLQANVVPIVLPTMNLTSLQVDLKNNTIVK